MTKEDVMAIADSVVCDLIYFLRGSEEASGTEEDPSDDAFFEEEAF